MKINFLNSLHYVFSHILALIGILFGRVINILKHNGVNILDYPDKSWSLVPFPGQKGEVFNADNCATVNRHDEAVFIECGTGQGYMAAAIAQYHNFRSDSPSFYLIDNYSADLFASEGVVIPSPASFAYSDNATEVQQYFKSYPSIKVVQGFIPGILNQLPERPIAFLHVDLNNVPAENAALPATSKQINAWCYYSFRRLWRG